MQSKKKLYGVFPISKEILLNNFLEDNIWNKIKSIKINNFRPESSNHRPITKVKLVYNKKGMFGLFTVKDKYIRCIHTKFQQAVYKDSCVEFFVRPNLQKGYFNFEFNCGGTMLCYYIENSKREKKGFKKFKRLTKEDGKKVKIFHSMPEYIEPEIKKETFWKLGFFIPFSVLKKYVGKININPGEIWHANFYKCGNETSHPHWGAWSKVDELNFHLPQCFGKICFN